MSVYEAKSIESIHSWIRELWDSEAKGKTDPQDLLTQSKEYFSRGKAAQANYLVLHYNGKAL